jgi:hypothetical protein
MAFGSGPQALEGCGVWRRVGRCSLRGWVGVLWLEQCPHTRSERHAIGAAPVGSGRRVVAEFWVASLGVDFEGTGDEHVDGAVRVASVEVMGPGKQPRTDDRG